MLIGEYQHNLDDKGRIIIPSKFRDQLNTSFILTRGLDGCLAIYSHDQWDAMFEKLKSMPTTKKVVRQYIRMLATQASECTTDKLGRIQIPSFLAKPVNIQKECIVVGANDHIEIWDKAAWENYFEEANDNFEEVAEELTDLFE